MKGVDNKQITLNKKKERLEMKNKFNFKSFLSGLLALALIITGIPIGLGNSSKKAKANETYGNFWIFADGGAESVTIENSGNYFDTGDGTYTFKETSELPDNLSSLKNMGEYYIDLSYTRSGTSTLPKYTINMKSGYNFDKFEPCNFFNGYNEKAIDYFNQNENVLQMRESFAWGYKGRGIYISATTTPKGITLNGANGATSTVSADEYDKFTLVKPDSMSAFKKVGYTSSSWKGGSTTYTAGEQTYSEVFEKSSGILNAIYTPKTYKVNFNNGSGASTTNSITATCGKAATLPTTTPSKSGYTFVEWTGNGGPYQPGGKINLCTDSDITLTASWTKDSYIVSYTGCTGIASNTGEYNTVITLPTPTKEGYTFSGWYDGSTKVGNAGDKYTITKTTTLTAHWEANVYKISFDANGGECDTEYMNAIYDSTYEYSLYSYNIVPATLPAASKKADDKYYYTFKGWAKKDSTTIIDVSDKYTTSSDSTLYAVYEAHEHVYGDWGFTYKDADDETEKTIINGQIILINGKFNYSEEQIADLEERGGFTGISSATVISETETTSILAKREAEDGYIQKIKYENGGFGTPSENITDATCTGIGCTRLIYRNSDENFTFVVYNSFAAALGHNFAGEYTCEPNNGLEDGVRYNVCDRCKEKIEGTECYFVRVDPDKSKGVIASINDGQYYPAGCRVKIQTLNELGEYTDPTYESTTSDMGLTAAPGYNGKTIKAFIATVGSDNTEITSGEFIMPAKAVNIIFTADPNNYKINYIMDIVTTPFINDKIDAYTYGTGCTLPTDVSARGYKFVGWYDNADFNGEPITSISDSQLGDVTIYAKFEKLTYTITYHLPEGVSIPSDSPTTFCVDDDFELPVATLENNNFIGWHEEEDLSDKEFTSLKLGTDHNLDLYPEFSDNQYTIKYVVPDGATITKSKTKFTVDDEFELPSVIYEGYKFVGWYKSSDYSGEAITKVEKGTKENLVLYAKLVENSGDTANSGSEDGKENSDGSNNGDGTNNGDSSNANTSNNDASNQGDGTAKSNMTENNSTTNNNTTNIVTTNASNSSVVATNGATKQEFSVPSPKTVKVKWKKVKKAKRYVVKVKLNGEGKFKKVKTIKVTKKKLKKKKFSYKVKNMTATSKVKILAQKKVGKKWKTIKKFNKTAKY